MLWNRASRWSNSKNYENPRFELQKSGFTCNYIKVCLSSKEERAALLTLLLRYEDLFDGTLQIWRSPEIALQLKKDAAIPHFVRPFPVPHVHERALKIEMEWLIVELGVLKWTKARHCPACNGCHPSNSQKAIRNNERFDNSQAKYLVLKQSPTKWNTSHIINTCQVHCYHLAGVFSRSIRLLIWAMSCESLPEIIILICSRSFPRRRGRAVRSNQRNVQACSFWIKHLQPQR